MTRLLTTKLTLLLASLALANHSSIALAQSNSDITWTANGDGSTFSDDTNWFVDDGMGGMGVFGPEISLAGDSLKFDGTTTGTTINNDLGAGLELNHGTGNVNNSGAFHFLSGSGNFTFTGFPVTAGVAASGSVIRVEEGAGLTQTFDLDINLFGNQRDRRIVLNNNGTVILNGQISYANSWLFPNEGAGRIELNGDNIGPGKNLLSAGFNGARSTFRNNVSGTVLALGSDTALGDATTGTFEGEDDGLGGRTNTLQLRGLTANQILTIEASAPRDLSAYYLSISNGSGGGGIKIDNASDTTIGYLMRTGNGTRTFSNVNSGTVIISEGLFASTNNAAQNTGLFAGGTVGNVEGGNGNIQINGKLYNTLIDPTTAANYDVNGDGTVFEDNSSRGGISAANQLTGADGVTPINGAINPRFGKVTLNGDSSATWIGSQVTASNFAIVVAGHDNAFGDSTSLVALNNSGVVDIGTHTIEQRFVSNGGTIRGNGTLTNEADWSIGGAVQPGGELPATSDTLTFDFTGNAVANMLQFEGSSALNFVLNSGTTSSTIDVLGSPGGGTDVVFIDDATINLTDLSGGSLALGDYTLINGDANTSFTLGSVAVAAPSGFSGSLSVIGDDLILSLIEAIEANADFDASSLVDGADFLTWQQNVGFTGPPNLQPFGDANGDDVIDGADLTAWRDQYGTNPSTVATASTSAVPEPTALVLLLVSLTACAANRRVRS